MKSRDQVIRQLDRLDRDDRQLRRCPKCLGNIPTKQRRIKLADGSLVCRRCAGLAPMWWEKYMEEFNETA